MPCQRHCLDCAADAQGYYNLAHYLQVNGGDVSALIPATDNAPVRHYSYPAPFDPPKVLESGESHVTSTGATVTPVPPIDLESGERLYVYDKMDWILFWLGIAAKVVGVGIVVFIGWKIIQAIMWVASWFDANGAAIVSTIGGIFALVVIGLIAFVLSTLGGGSGGADFSFKGTGKFLR